MSRRSRLEIQFEILDVIERGVTKPTQIMYKTNLSWNVLQDTLSTLIKSGFLKEEPKGKSKRLQVTKKGRNALSYHTKSLDGLIISNK
ncbi:MAG: 45 protein [Thermoproteota archaeon]|nr:45 protein [Thermoproteota archaeon]